ncbi:hypothetical protein [Acinetobacter baumannii]|uniref:hypothetical protein n=1 Tax=Acinetobacter baumannii TaxID=470 RepID=UPI001D173CB1|nr:hypothetical protein [Acinetobacter baumannii]
MIQRISGCRPMSKNEFNTRCVWAGHDLSACNCIYNSLEQHYSPQFVESLPKLSLQNIDAKMNFVETMNQTMQQCQLSASKH